MAWLLLELDDELLYIPFDGEFVALANWDDDDDVVVVVGIKVSGIKWGVRRDIDGSMGLGGQWYVPAGTNEEFVVETGELLKEKLHWLKIEKCKKKTKKDKEKHSF